MKYRLYSWILWTGEEVGNAGPISTKVKDNSSKFTYYGLVWHSKMNGKKNCHSSQDLSHSIQSKFNLIGQKRSLLI